MDATIISVVVTAAVTLTGAWLGFRGTKASTQTSDLSAAADYWKKAVDRQDTQLARQTEQIDALTEKVDAVMDENRTFRHALIGVIERLQRIPPPEHHAILQWVLDNVPSLKEKP